MQRGRHENLGTTFEGPAPDKILEGKKRPQILSDFRQLQTLIANISVIDQDIDKQKAALSTTIPLPCRPLSAVSPTEKHTKFLHLWLSFFLGGGRHQILSPALYSETSF